MHTDRPTCTEKDKLVQRFGGSRGMAFYLAHHGRSRPDGILWRSSGRWVKPSVSWRNLGPFCLLPTGAILRTCPGLSSNRFLRPPSSLKRCSAILGHSPAGRQSMTSRPGSSPTTGPSMSRSRKPRWMCSRRGSAISSMSCSGRADDVTGRHTP